MKNKRSSGLLLHITSLPGKYGIGTMGKEAFAFVDFLEKAGQKIWQILPLGHTGYGDSPYQCFSAFAGNPLLIDLDLLVKNGFLANPDLPKDKNFNDDNVDFGRVFTYKYPILRKAFKRFKENQNQKVKEDYRQFVEESRIWLDDYAFFMALKDHFGGKSWSQWNNDIKTRQDDAMASYRYELDNEIKFYYFVQYAFYTQWQALKKYANQKGISIIGDIPLYVAADSSDAWANTHLFDYDKDLNPITVAGVPPDYFSVTGQLWGNPIYKWDVHKQDGFAWWIERVKANLVLYDTIRIDHFRGLAAYWAVPFGAETAINGQWIDAPGKELMRAIINALGDAPIIAEDLGVITPDVEELRDGFNLPGMKILQFAFDSGEENDFMPHTFVKNCVVYTGTHDNDTTLGQYKSVKPEDRKQMKDYFCLDPKDPAWSFVKLAWSSVADVAIAPLQDILRLGGHARMNFPGKAAGNWMWRFKKQDLKTQHAKELLKITKLYGR
jgi:4-alpha-glucanotransferase